MPIQFRTYHICQNSRDDGIYAGIYATRLLVSLACFMFTICDHTSIYRLYNYTEAEAEIGADAEANAETEAKSDAEAKADAEVKAETVPTREFIN